MEEGRRQRMKDTDGGGWMIDGEEWRKKDGEGKEDGEEQNMENGWRSLEDRMEDGWRRMEGGGWMDRVEGGGRTDG